MSRIGIVVFLCAMAAGPGWAQQTREEQRAAAQAEKAKNLQVYVPGPIEKYSARLEQTFQNPPPVYAYIGGIYPGGAFAVGPGARHRFVSGALADVHGAWSIRNYKMIDASFKLPPMADRRVLLETHANWIDAPTVGFFGVGTDAERSNRTNFEYRSITAGGSARVRVLPAVNVGAAVDYLSIDSDRDDFRPLVERFGAPVVTGLKVSPTYTRTNLFAAVDWRDAPGYNRRGGLYRVDVSSYRERNGGPHSFTRVDGEIDQFVPFLQPNWVLAFRLLGSVTDSDDGDVIPYALLPALGGGSELRGYANWRFRDRSRLLISGEYRWLAGQLVDMALFLDAGKVAPRSENLDLSDLYTSYGVGIRFHTPASTVLRTEVARTRDGLGLVFAFGPSF